jgi:hypothetical protein
MKLSQRFFETIRGLRKNLFDVGMGLAFLVFWRYLLKQGIHCQLQLQGLAVVVSI